MPCSHGRSGISVVYENLQLYFFDAVLVIALEHDDDIIWPARNNVVDTTTKVAGHCGNYKGDVLSGDTPDSQSVSILILTLCSPEKIDTIS